MILLEFLATLKMRQEVMSEEFTRIATALERIANALEHLHIGKIDHAHIDDIGEIHGDVVTHPKQF